jgi:hypothetical protein
MATSDRRDGLDGTDGRDQLSGMIEDHTHDEMQDGIEECLNCHAVCTMTLQHCIASGGDHVEVNLIGLILDCAEMCQTSANFMLRGSPYHVITCAACAELCRACEEACRAIAGDEQLSHCADVCASCADSCDRMAEMGADGTDE